MAVGDALGLTAEGILKIRQLGLYPKIDRYQYYGLILRNLVFTLMVLGHGFQRLLPPY
jgi:hypothetical protein